MQQRRLRLGDIVDDYCPRERRITNHAVVAMIDDQVKQTRCTTCDADHEYKQAKVPAQRKKKGTPAALHGEGPAGTPRKRAATADVEPPADIAAQPEAPIDKSEPAESLEVDEPSIEVPAAAVDASASTPQSIETDEPVDDEGAASDDDGPVHRPLIRATLPRPEGQVPERKMPEFTAHQRETNGNRHGRRRGPRPGQARGPHGSMGQTRFGGPRQGHGTPQGSGPGQRQGSAQGQRQNPGRPGQRSGQGQPGQPRQGRPGGGGRKRGR